MATDQVESGGVSMNAAFWNAAARGVGLKAVLDHGSLRPGAAFTALVIRKDLYDAGRGRTLADLRGLNLVNTPPGKATTNYCAMSYALQRASVSSDDISITPLPFPDMPAALANGAIDGGLFAEPFLTRTLKQGSGVMVMGQDEMYPNFTVSAVCFTPALYADRAAARGFAHGYIRAIRDYLEAIGRPSGDAERARVEELMASYTRIDAPTVHEMVPASFSPNGLPNQGSILFGYQYFREQGLIAEPVSDAALAAMWGTELVEEVLRDLGRLPEDWGLRPAAR
jgi:NitT/TauT family transport system substrate-binding protein